MTLTPTILIVDDSERLCISLKRRLDKVGKYRVFTAGSAEEALALCERECIHCIGLDIILTNDTKDRTGFELAKKLGKIPKFFLSMAEDRRTVKYGTSREMRQQANVQEYLYKSDDVQEILRTVNEIVGDLNLDLVIHWGTWSDALLVEMLKHFKGKSDSEKRVIADELVTLFCSAFKSATEITLLKIDRGKGGCVVAQIEPRMQHAAGAPVMVKFGPRETIMVEYENYTKWVKHFLRYETTQILENPAQTFHLAAINYSFVGGSNPKGSFKDVFNDYSAQEIEGMLAHLIGHTCERWYEARRPPEPEESLPLDGIYRSRECLNLVDKHVAALDTIVGQLLNSKSHASSLKADGPATIAVRLGSISERLPNPMYYAFRERWNNGFEAELFPSPSQLAITHGDLNGDNILVDDHGRGCLIDFYKTGFGPIYRDFVELESIIKFELLKISDLQQRYRLESDLLAPARLSDPIPIADEFKHDVHALKVISVIQQIRRLAALKSNSEDPTEYYVGLIFNALKEILGFSSGHDDPTCCNVRQFHALISAAKICQKLMQTQTKPEGSGSPPLIFLSYAQEDVAAVAAIYERLAREGFKPWMALHDIHPGMIWKSAVDVALEQAYTIVVVLSKWAVQNRGYSQYEIKRALELSMRMLPDDRYLIPVVIERLEPEATIPRELQHLQVAEVYESNGLDRFLQSLRESVARRDR